MGLEVRRYDTVVTATRADLPAAVASRLEISRIDEAEPGLVGSVRAAAIRWATRSWGPTTDPPLLLLHGIMSDSGVFWRLGPALAAAGWSVTAVDLPAHGDSGPWQGRYALAETAADLAGCIGAMYPDVGRVAVVGHSWGGMVAAGLPAAGVRPRTTILLDPPHLELDELIALTRDPMERSYGSLEEARAGLVTADLGWSEGDIEAKARALTRFHPEGVRAILTRNGAWDAGLSLLGRPAADGRTVWYVRGEPRFGGLIPDEMLPRLARRVGPDHVLTVAGGSHAPMRTRHPESVALAILLALRRLGDLTP